MITLALICFLCLVFIDLRTLRPASEVAFEVTFRKSRWIIISLIVLGVFVWVKEPLNPSAMSSFFLLFLIPYYAHKRERWLKEIESQYVSYQQEFSHTIKLKIEAIGVVLHWSCWMIFLSVAYWCAEEIWPRPLPELMELIISAAYSSLVLVILIYQSSKCFSNRGFWFNVGLRRGKTPWLKMIFLPALLGIIFAIISAWIISGRNIQPQTPLGDILDETTSPNLLMMFLTLALAIAPFVEEITFRGYFYHVIKKNNGRFFAIIVIALTFALLHVQQYWGDWLAILMVTILGFCLTLIRAKTGSTIGGVVMHYVYNTGVTIIPVIMLIAANSAYFEYQAKFDQLNFAQKEQLLTKSIKDQPQFADSYNDLAWLYAESGVKLDEAIKLIDQALALAPENVAYVDTKAEILTKSEQYEEALELRQHLYADLEDKDSLRAYQLEKIKELEEILNQEP